MLQRESIKSTFVVKGLSAVADGAVPSAASSRDFRYENQTLEPNARAAAKR